MTALAPIRLVRSRLITLKAEGQVRVVIDLQPDIGLFQVCTEHIESGHLFFPEVFDSLELASRALGARVTKILNRATAERRSEKEEAA